MKYILALLLSLTVSVSFGQAPVQQMQLSPEIRAWFKNPDGSCVQCSIGMCGVHSNDPKATTLLWDTEYGSAERRGSNPSRVEAYMERRNIVGWSITGKENTMEWMKWAAGTRRFAAIGAATAHFQTLYGYDPNTQKWYVCNNNSTSKIDEYTQKEFERLHAASGYWIVVLEKSSSENPVIVEWWK